MHDHIDVSNSRITLIFDGECPFCTSYARLARARSRLPELQLINARSKDPHHQSVITDIQKRGMSFDDGIVLLIGNDAYHGAQALHILSLISHRWGWFNRLNRALFGSPPVAHRIYPVLRWVRNLTLKLLGVAKIDA